MTQVNYRIATTLAAIAIGSQEKFVKMIDQTTVDAVSLLMGALKRDKLLNSEPTK